MTDLNIESSNNQDTAEVVQSTVDVQSSDIVMKDGNKEASNGESVNAQTSFPTVSTTTKRKERNNDDENDSNIDEVQSSPPKKQKQSKTMQKEKKQKDRHQRGEPRCGHVSRDIIYGALSDDDIAALNGIATRLPNAYDVRGRLRTHTLRAAANTQRRWIDLIQRAQV
ncbi:MAG: hypothetical protein IPK82_23105 [Polyangiaceae bacterium]|nr:hypothetical protein [Polyangiaceae bacterium]